MVGKHESPKKRSFYFSLATSTLRVVIVIAAVVVGGLVLRNAFPTGAAVVPPPSSGSNFTPPPATAGSPGPTPSKPRVAKPRVKGVVIQVKNGTSRTGLAADVTQTLRAAGYTAKLPGNAPLTSTTTIYYQSDQKLNAQGLLRKYFPGASLRPAPPSVPSGVDIEIILGDDFVNTGTRVSPSP